MTAPRARIEDDIDDQVDVLRDVVASNAREIQVASAAIATAEAVRVLAVGSSRHAGGFGAGALRRFAASHVWLAPAPGHGIDACGPKESVAVAVSQSGETPSVLEAAYDCKRLGAALVVITNNADAHLAALGDVVLRCDAGPERVVPATKSVTSAMLLLLAVARSARDLDIASLGRVVSRAICADLSDSLDAKPPTCVVVSGTCGEWIADEIALKFAEVARLPVASEPLVEFIHGHAGAHRNVLAFAEPADPNVAILRQQSDTRLIQVPSTGDPWLDPIPTTVIGQRLAVCWARAVGTDPDDSAGLTKVVATR